MTKIPTKWRRLNLTEQTYIERTTTAIEALESALRRLFKADDTPPIPYVYNGATYDVRDRETRMLVIAAIQDAYYRDHGEHNQYALDAWYAKGSPGQRPTPVPANAALLDRLTNVALFEELTDANPYKAQHNEYPFYSDTQLDRIRNGRRGSEPTNMRGETPVREDGDLGPGVILSADGRDHGDPRRRNRTKRENVSVDAGAKIRNKARAAQYKRDTAEGPVKSYNLRDTGGELTEEFTQQCGIGERWLAGMSAVNEVIVEPAEICVRGGGIMIELNRIYNEDCLAGMRRIPDKGVDMILCDLPYGTTQNKWDSVIPLGSLWEEYLRIIKDDGAIVLTAQTPFDKVLGASNLALLRYEWIWEKNKPTGHLNAKKMPMKAHENILVFYRKLPTYVPQGLQLKLKPTVSKGGAGNGTNYGKSDRDALQVYENYPRDVLRFDMDTKTVHPTQKPVDLFRYLIRTYTNPGETILDNCMGSGTTAVAALLEGRNFIGFEMDAGYVEFANRRLGLLINQAAA